MAEKQKKPAAVPEQQKKPADSGPAPVPSTSGQAEIISGIYTETGPFAGTTVGELRKSMATKMNVDPKAQAVVDGALVDDKYVLKEGEVLNFVKAAGEKG